MKTVILLSGGMDSTTLLYEYTALYGPENVRALSFDYGQRHQKEMSFAYLNATKLGVAYQEVDLSSIKKILPGSSQTDRLVDVPEGRYDEESMKLTVVPNRNMILLSIAIGHAIATGFDCVAYAAHGGDHAIYPDCRPEFAAVIEQAARLCDWKPIEIHRPFILLTKGDIVKKGAALGVNFTQTWSCYAGRNQHCGRCGTCYERILAFKEAGVIDPTTYTDPDFALAKEAEHEKNATSPKSETTTKPN